MDMRFRVRTPGCQLAPSSTSFGSLASVFPSVNGAVITIIAHIVYVREL